MKKVEVIHLTDAFYDKYPHREYDQILYRKEGRGYYYGVIIVELFNAKFAIPLHSNVKNGLKIRQDKMTGYYSGLDFEKAVVIENESYLGELYEVKPKSDYNVILRKKNHIERQFKKYILQYIKAVEKNDLNILNREYPNTSLKYFHHILLKKFPKFCLLNPLTSPTNIPKSDWGY